jgi:hypothetical protein|tara:strand:+ start:12877 stop:13065 length:189 start_codon:yes stop_codon:yes gene_type:complete
MNQTNTTDEFALNNYKKTTPKYPAGRIKKSIGSGVLNAYQVTKLTINQKERIKEDKRKEGIK